MNTLIRIVLILALAGCSTIDSKPIAREALKNPQGHVIGYKDLMRDERTGEELAQLTLFVPRLGEHGEIVGARWLDVRSRGSNPQNKGLLIMVRGKDSERAAVAQAPSIEELIQLARLGN
jgi:hypothetical protein